MTFLHPYLLAGLALVALPVLIHLIMRQKPKTLPFPAFRFLRQRHLINRRRMQLQHLLLLALRMLLIGVLCLGLARPRVESQSIGVGREHAVAAVLVFDTSASMEYAVAGQSRLEEAKQRALELLDETSPASRLLVLDTGDETGGDPSASDWLGPEFARQRIDQLKIRFANAPLNRQVERAFRLLQMSGESESDDPMPRFLFVFSDRTRASWDAAEAQRLTKPEGVHAVYVDVGVDNARDLAINQLEVEPAAASPGGRIRLKATVRATGADHDSKLICALDNEPDLGRPAEERHVDPGAGQSQVVVIERPAPALPTGVVEAFFQATARLATNDALPFNNARFATFLVREPRKILTIADEPRDARIWKAALDAVGAFRSEVRTPEMAEKLTAKELQQYRLIALFQVARPTRLLWDRLASFVKAGGGLVLVPRGDDLKPARDDYNAEGESRGLLPARWETIVQVPPGQPGIQWSSYNPAHLLTAPFQAWSRTTTADFTLPELQPQVNAFWAVKPLDGSVVIARYTDELNRPILVERVLERGTILQFTTPLDGKELARNRHWHNYWSDSSFGLVLTDLACRYLAGDNQGWNTNFYCGQPATVKLPTTLLPPLKLNGPNLTAAETNVGVPVDGQPLTILQAATPGNYTIVDGKGLAVAGFSMNVRGEESLLDRVPVEELETVLGEKSVLPLGRRTSLQDALEGRWSPPVELMPWLMMAVLLGLSTESLLANRFYRKVE